MTAVPSAAVAVSSRGAAPLSSRIRQGLEARAAAGTPNVRPTHVPAWPEKSRPSVDGKPVVAFVAAAPSPPLFPREGMSAGQWEARFTCGPLRLLPMTCGGYVLLDSRRPVGEQVLESRLPYVQGAQAFAFHAARLERNEEPNPEFSPALDAGELDARTWMRARPHVPWFPCDLCVPRARK